ncbi:MAG: Uma2 family endonuclease [Elainellaceae cyanobacterium]
MSVPAVQSTPVPPASALPEDLVLPPSEPYSDEPPLESSLHLQQLLLLLKCLDWLWKDRNDYFTAGNLTIYYSPHQRKSEDFRGPDLFVVLGAEKRPRNSWVVWHEGGLYPHAIIELLSDSTAKTDRGLKKDIYQDIFRTPDYFWFHPHTLEFEGFHLADGTYQPIPVNEQGWRWSQQLQLYLGVYENQLRFFTAEGVLVPTPEESAAAERQRADAEYQRAEAERQRAEAERQQTEAERQRNERLAARLRELGVNPDDVL